MPGLALLLRLLLGFRRVAGWAILACKTSWQACSMVNAVSCMSTPMPASFRFSTDLDLAREAAPAAVSPRAEPPKHDAI